MIIGGEFAIPIDRLNNVQTSRKRTENYYCYSSGRSALYYILIYLKEHKNIKRVLLPDYLCSSIVDTIKQVGLSVKFTSLTKDLVFDINELKNNILSNDVVLVINYFGLQNVNLQIDLIKTIAPQCPIIEDDVQAFFHFWDYSSKANFRFTSLRKSFAIPDGGLVQSREPLYTTHDENNFSIYKIAGGILKSLSPSNAEIEQTFLELLAKGESLIQKDIRKTMSIQSKNLFETENISYSQIRRKENADVILKGIEELGIKTIIPVNKTHTPLFVPIYLNNRNKIRKILAENQIYCPVHWPLKNLPLQMGKEMEEHELSIVIDQRYGKKEMNKILKIIADHL